MASEARCENDTSISEGLIEISIEPFPVLKSTHMKVESSNVEATIYSTQLPLGNNSKSNHNATSNLSPSSLRRLPSLHPPISPSIFPPTSAASAIPPPQLRQPGSRLIRPTNDRSSRR